MEVTTEQSKDLIKKFLKKGLREKRLSANAAMLLGTEFGRTKTLISLVDDDGDGKASLKFDPEEMRSLLQKSENEIDAKNAFYASLDSVMNEVIANGSRKNGKMDEKSKLFERVAKKSSERSGVTLPKPKKMLRTASVTKKPLGGEIRSFVANAKKSVFTPFIPRDEDKAREFKKAGEDFKDQQNVAVAIDVTGPVSQKEVDALFQKLTQTLERSAKLTIIEVSDGIRKTYSFNPEERQAITIKKGSFNPECVLPMAEGFYDALIVLSVEKWEPENTELPVMSIIPKELKNG